MDDQIIQGKLDNGLTYYIRENDYPKERASLHLVVKVGSIYEQEGEEGIAHFIEHLAFRGSEHFKDGEVWRYLDSIGSPIGADSNAFTNYTSTIYQLNIPLNTDNALENALTILCDFASTATLKDEVIEKERTVVLDELHQAVSSIDSRLRNKIMHSFLPHSPYTHHDIIGLEKVIRTVSSNTLRDFYKRWYRPDRMAIIAVGDFDSKTLKQKIENCFSKIVCPKEDSIEPLQETKFIEEPQAVIHLDPEVRATSISLFSFYPTSASNDPTTTEDVKHGLLSSACIRMLNDRLQKLVNLGPHFLNAVVSKGTYCGNIKYFNCWAALFENHYEEGLKALHLEIQKALKQGFTQAEWQKLHNEWKLTWQNDLNNRDKVYHQSYVSDCIDHFLKGESFISKEWLLQTKLATTITIDEINAFLPSSHLADSFKIFFLAPSKKVQESMSENNLLKLFEEEVEATDLIEEVMDLSFNVNPKLPVGKIAHIQEDQKTKVTYWTLENGIHLILKNTDLEHDQVYISALAQGGLTAFSKEDFQSAVLAPEYGIKSGVINGLTHEQLKDLLHSKGIYPNFSLDSDARMIHLNASHNHLETAFQCIHSFFTMHSFDQKKWQHLITKNQELLRQQYNDPDYHFGKIISEINRQNHFYFQPFDVEQADEKKTREIFELCYQNPQDFTFVIVGDFNQEQIRHLVEKYLGSLSQNPPRFFPSPAIPELFPQRIIHEELRKGHNSYATTLISMPGDVGAVYKQYGNFYNLHAVAIILKQRLTENLRHQLGNTYGVQVYFDTPFFDLSNSLLSVQFTSQPEHGKEMVELVLKEIETFKKVAPSQEEISGVQSVLREFKKRDEHSNGYWIDAIRYSQQRNIPLDYILDYEKHINELTPEGVKKAAQIICSSPHYSVLSHLPEQETEPLGLTQKRDVKAD